MVPVYQVVREVELLELDPMEVYEALKGEYTYILQSAEGGEKIARYSFIGVNPALHLKVRYKVADYRTFDSNLRPLKLEKGNPIDAVKKVMEQFNFQGKSDLRFTGGLVGYLSYDIVGYYHPIQPNQNPKQKTIDNLKEPDCEFTLARNNIIYDHVERKTYVTENYFNLKEKRQAEGRLDKLINRILDIEIKQAEKTQKKGRTSFKSNLTQSQFEGMVEKAKYYIKAGDIFQVVLSQRLSAKYDSDPLDVYRKLKEINPSPYMYYLDFKERKIVGSSPEMLARVEGSTVVTYPIAGTRSRGKTVREDKQLEMEMLHDTKERAEHTMLVDLGRNDIGRVAQAGSVKVKKFMHVEKYSHVQHLVSEVSGKLKKNLDCYDALKSIFPAGTVSGAPKVRAMEIIDELEPNKRGIYAGCIGYFSFNGNMDTAIAIRTIVFEKNKAYAQAGAGIVSDSVLEYEYKETLKKANALLKALE